MKEFQLPSCFIVTTEDRDGLHPMERGERGENGRTSQMDTSWSPNWIRVHRIYTSRSSYAVHGTTTLCMLRYKKKNKMSCWAVNKENRMGSLEASHRGRENRVQEEGEKGTNGAANKDSLLVIQKHIVEAAKSISHTTQSMRQEDEKKNSGRTHSSRKNSGEEFQTN